MENVIQSFNDGFLMLSCAKRRSGKTTFIVNMLLDRWIEEYGIENIFLFYPDVFKPGNQYSVIDFETSNCDTKYDEDVVMALLQRQKKMVKDGTAKKILFIFDDCVAGDGFTKSNFNSPLTEMAVRGRHDLISAVIASQYITGFNTKIRANADIAIIYKAHGEDYEHLGKVFRPTKSKKEFFTIMDEYLKEYFSFLVINYSLKRMYAYVPSEKTFKFLMEF